MAMENYPNGAHALLIALQTPGLKGQTGIPVLLWGRPGVGKSSFLEALDRPDFPVLTLIASIHDPTDFSGLPVHHDGKVHYAVPEWVKLFEGEGVGLLFLDELTTAPPSVQAALLRVVLERKVGFHALPPGVRIVAAANPPDLMSGGWELSPPLRNRFVHLQWDLSVGAYLVALEQGFPEAELPTIDAGIHAAILPEWKYRIAAFLKRSPDLLHTSPESDPYAFASPRSWDFVAALLTSCEMLEEAPVNGRAGSRACLELLKGCIGEGVAIPFMEFLKNLKLPDPQEVLAGRVNVDVATLDDSELYVLFGGLNRVLHHAAAEEKVLGPALRYLETVKSVIENGRQDLIYVPLVNALQQGWIGKAQSAASAISAEDPGIKRRLTALIGELFALDGLLEYTEIISPQN